MPKRKAQKRRSVVLIKKETTFGKNPPMNAYEKLARKYSKVKYSPALPRGTLIALLKTDLAGGRPSGKVRMSGSVNIRLQCPQCGSHLEAHLDLDLD